jgi:hypothetical protein
MYVWSLALCGLKEYGVTGEALVFLGYHAAVPRPKKGKSLSRRREEKGEENENGVNVE